MNSVNFYKCNPYKNITCKKTTCYMHGGNCYLTTDKKASLDGGELKESEGWTATKAQYDLVKNREFAGTSDSFHEVSGTRERMG